MNSTAPGPSLSDALALVPNLPDDQHVLRGFWDKADKIISEVRLAMSASADAKAWCAKNGMKLPLSAAPATTRAYAVDPAGQFKTFLSSFPDLLDYLPLTQLSGIHDAQATGDYTRGAERFLAAIEALRERIRVKLDLMADSGTVASLPTDLLTTAELAMLAGVGVAAFRNALSKARRAGAQAPSAVVEGSGKSNHQYSYAEARPFLLRKWPGRAVLFPAKFAEIRAWLATQELRT